MIKVASLFSQLLNIFHAQNLPIWWPNMVQNTEPMDLPVGRNWSRCYSVILLMQIHSVKFAVD